MSQLYSHIIILRSIRLIYANIYYDHINITAFIINREKILLASPESHSENILFKNATIVSDCSSSLISK